MTEGTSTAPSTAGASPGADTVIRLDRVSKRFADFVAVEAADFDIAEGEFFSMLGPSGCGKTTTLRMIAGFEQPTVGPHPPARRGRVAHAAHKRDVNTVFQNYALFPHMTVFDNVAFGLRNKKTPSTR